MNYAIRIVAYLDVDFISKIELTCWGSNGATSRDPKFGIVGALSAKLPAGPWQQPVKLHL